MKNTFLQILLNLCLVSAAGPIAAAPTTNAAPAAPATPHIVASSSALTSDEWQELRAARQAALKANPGFVTKSAQLTAKMRAFQDKLDAAMLKTDPKLAPVLVKFEGVHHATQMSPASPQTHE